MGQHLALLLGALLQVWYLGASFVTVCLLSSSRLGHLTFHSGGLLIALVVESYSFPMHSACASF